MRLVPHHSRIDRLARVLLPAIALVIGLGWQGRASATPAVSFEASDEVQTHPHRCKCGMHCGKSCCCDPDKKTGKDRPKPAAADEPPRAGPAPCLSSAPCRDSGLPSTPTAGPFGKVAALDLGGLVRPDEGGRLLPSVLDCTLPPRNPSRIDDPPDRTDAA